jgi:nitrogen-specific signal transduction histidine kinase/ActR/RegA family two-component response regulator
MTERRAAQQALDAAREQLFQAQKLDALGQLTGGVAHDFNNILTVVIGYLDLLAQRLEGRERAAAAAALRAAERAVGLTKRLLSFGRRQMLNPCATNVNCLIEQMREMLSRTLGEQVAIRAILAADVWPCFIDPNELEAALLNLAINARDAMPVGGTLTIETTNAHLDTGCATPYDNIVPGDYTLISVSDTGLGIPRENLSKVLEPFFTTKEVGAGSGLGLPQVYGFARQSGGYVTICSEVGIGTTVRLYLPRHSAEESAFLEEVPSEAPRARDSESVLVVEDNPTVQSFAIQCFRDLGYRIFEAEDAPRALQLLKVHPEIDLLFTDIGLPGMNGAQLAVEAVRHRPDLKVVYTTGYAGAILPAADTLQTEIAVLAKPFTRDKLAISARQALDQSLRYRVRWPA